MNTKTRVIASISALIMTIAGASACKLDLGNTKNETCEIVARDTTTLTTKCTDENGKDTGNGEVKNYPSDIYPLCQVGTFWPGCKTAK